MRKLDQINNIEAVENLEEVKGGCVTAWNIQKSYAGLSCCGPYAAQYSNSGCLTGGTVSASWSNLWGSASWSWSWGTAANTCVPKPKPC